MKKLSVFLVVALVAAALVLAGFAKNSSHEALKSNNSNEPNSHHNIAKEVTKPEKSSENPAPPAQAAEVKVTKDDAKAAALAHAGVNEADVKHYKVEVDKERNATVYEIEFDAGNHEYDYVVNAETGKIVHSEVEKDRGAAQANNNQKNEADKAPAQPAADAKISKDDAKAAALAHAGLNENDISRFKAELDKERNGLVYEIEFDADKYEYEYEISAEDGKVLKHKKEIRD